MPSKSGPVIQFARNVNKTKRIFSHLKFCYIQLGKGISTPDLCKIQDVILLHQGIKKLS